MRNIKKHLLPSVFWNLWSILRGTCSKGILISFTLAFFFKERFFPLQVVCLWFILILNSTSQHAHKLFLLFYHFFGGLEVWVFVLNVFGSLFILVPSGWLMKYFTILNVGVKESMALNLLECLLELRLFLLIRWKPFSFVSSMIMFFHNLPYLSINQVLRINEVQDFSTQDILFVVLQDFILHCLQCAHMIWLKFLSNISFQFEFIGLYTWRPSILIWCRY